MAENKDISFIIGLIKETLKIIAPIVLGLNAEVGLSTLNVSQNMIWLVLVILGIWFIISLFLFLKKRLVAYRDDKQSDGSIFFLPTGYDDRRVHNEVITEEIKGFLWLLHFSFPRGRNVEEYRNGKRSIREIKIESINGPYCPKDECEMNEEKT